MESGQNRSLVLQFYKAFDDRSIESALELLAPDFVAHLAGMPDPLDKKGFEQFGMTFYSAFGRGQHQFDQVIVDADKVVTWGTFSAVHLGEFQGLPPTGKPIKLAVMHIDRVENGKIVEHWGQGDAFGLMQQLGIVFLPGLTLVQPLVKSFMAKLFQRSPSL